MLYVIILNQQYNSSYIMTKKMKKAISCLSILSLIFALNGCGGGSGSSGATQTSSTEETEEIAQTYTFENATTSLNIEISFQLSKGGFAQTGESIRFETFDETYGYMSNQNILTDTNGIGIFTYNPPEIMPDANKYLSINNPNFRSLKRGLLLR